MPEHRHRRPRDREDDVPHDAQAARAVHPRRLDQLGRQRLHQVLPHEEDAEGAHQRSAGSRPGAGWSTPASRPPCTAGRRSAAAGPSSVPITSSSSSALRAEPQLGEGVPRERGEHDRAERDGARDDAVFSNALPMLASFHAVLMFEKRFPPNQKGGGVSASRWLLRDAATAVHTRGKSEPRVKRVEHDVGDAPRVQLPARGAGSLPVRCAAPASASVPSGLPVPGVAPVGVAGVRGRPSVSSVPVSLIGFCCCAAVGRSAVDQHR